jgi:hypothetical protein
MVNWGPNPMEFIAHKETPLLARFTMPAQINAPPDDGVTAPKRVGAVLMKNCNVNFNIVF